MKPMSDFDILELGSSPKYTLTAKTNSIDGYIENICYSCVIKPIDQNEILFSYDQIKI